MSRLQWDKPGEHFFENGVSNGVLFKALANGQGHEKGVAWNGLTNVTQSPTGGELSAVYADNIKYLNLMSAEEFAGSIEAYTYPDEFMECDGSVEPVEGFKLDQQPRRPFAFCYQTKIGSDANPELGFKVHIIYGALASPSERAYETVNDSPEAMQFSWDINCTPVPVKGYKPVAHIELDSRKVPEAKMTSILNALYGVDADPDHQIEGSDPTLLLPDDIIDILNAQ